MRDLIISEIKRLAAESGGSSPGVRSFESATGISQSKWRGVYWARWNDALVEAGFQGNTLQGRLDSDAVLRKVAELCCSLGKMPTFTEMRLRRRKDPDFPNDKTVVSHFGSMADLTAALRELAGKPEFAELAPLLTASAPTPRASQRQVEQEGLVYLLKSGQHYKIGRSENLERRIREISVALPESTTIIHAIRTDDPVGIEAYWHRRFANRRANGEWFRLSPEDLKAFRRRSYQ